MKITAPAIARAVVELVSTLPQEQHGALADAAVALLASRGLFRHARTFPSLVERIWRKQEGIVPLCITTQTGNAGPVKDELLRAVAAALGRPCSLEERADTALLGGMLVAVGDERFDATLRRSLSDLAARFLEPIPLSS